MTEKKGGDGEKDKETLTGMWETLRFSHDENCVMVAESWEHGVNCSWGGECPLTGAERKASGRVKLVWDNVMR